MACFSSLPDPPTSSPTFLQAIVARRWLLVFLPTNAASAGFSVALPLLILLAFHGNVLDVALAGTLYNAAIIPASLLWGVVCDRLGVRAPLLLLNYAAFTVAFLVLGLWPSLTDLLVVYTAYGIVAPSGTAASNLLIMERFPLVERPTAFASFSELSILGNVLGTLLGLLWVLRFPGASGLLGILYLCAATSAMSALGVALFVRDAAHRHPRSHLAHHPASLVARLHSHIPYFPHLPRRSEKGFLSGAARWLRQEATHEVPLMLAGGFLFNLGSNLFNTSYTPYMNSVLISTSGIFLVNLSNSAGQALVLPFSARACGGARAESVVRTASWARAAAYGCVFLLALLPALLAGGAVLGVNVLAFGLIGVTYAFYSTASSLLLFRSLDGRNAGSLLGANGALGGLAAVLGAASSGVLSHDLSFAATFIVAAVSIALAVPAWALALRAYRRRGALSPVRVFPAPQTA